RRGEEQPATLRHFHPVRQAAYPECTVEARSASRRRRLKQVTIDDRMRFRARFTIGRTRAAFQEDWTHARTIVMAHARRGVPLQYPRDCGGESAGPLRQEQ